MPKHYSQKNPRWAYQQLGTCKGWNIYNGGCFVTSLAMLYDDVIENPRGAVVECHPGILDWIATTKGLYASGCNVVQSRFAELLNLKDGGKRTIPPSYPCIAETNDYKNIGISQHFFVHYPDGTIVDPLDGSVANLWTPSRKKNTYNIVSYRWLEKQSECAECAKCCPEHCYKN